MKNGENGEKVRGMKGWRDGKMERWKDGMMNEWKKEPIRAPLVEVRSWRVLKISYFMENINFN